MSSLTLLLTRPARCRHLNIAGHQHNKPLLAVAARLGRIPTTESTLAIVPVGLCDSKGVGLTRQRAKVLSFNDCYRVGKTFFIARVNSLVEKTHLRAKCTSSLEAMEL